MADAFLHTDKFCAIPNQVSCDLADETVILALDAGIYYGLNAVGASIWKLIQQPRTLEEICNGLREEYEIDPQTCEQEVRQLIAGLHAKNLISIESVNSEQ